MAAVYLARDLKHERYVALKVLRPELASVVGEGTERFLQEVRINARLDHPHILTLIDSGEAGGFLYYTLPYVTGESLRHRLDRERQLPVDDAVRIATQVALALDYAHGKGIVHRDVKPENVLLHEGEAMVADFGIALAVRESGGLRFTQSGMSLGTPQYMSPEQATGDRLLDARSDIYSLGAMLYEMLAGEPPHSGPTMQAIVARMLTERPTPVNVLRDAVPASVVAAVSKALERLPADRYASAAEFAEALSRRDSPAAPKPAPAATAAARRPWRAVLIAAGTVAAAGVLLLLLRYGRAPHPPASKAFPRTAIAVLPFENLSPAGSDAYFAGGLQEELLTQLSRVAALTVVSRTSVMGYSGKNEPLRQIATELGVGSLVEGSVQIAGDRMRVNVQLIDAATDAPLWAERYDRTLDDAFAVQSDVAQRIVAAVGAALSGVEQQGLAAVPTTSAEAYRLYLQGNEYISRPDHRRQDLESAQQLYERALALDSSFALAHAELSQINGLMTWFRFDLSPSRLERQRAEAQTALRLAPDLAQGHVAMALAHMFGQRDYRRALAEFRVALNGLPNDAGVWAWIGYVERRLGNWNEVLTAFNKATQLDPRAADLFHNLGGNTYRLLHRYPDAVRADEQALSLAPDLYAATIARGWTYLRWQGQVDTLRAALASVPGDADLGTYGTLDGQRVRLLLWERQADSLLKAVAAARVGAFVAYSSYLPASLYAAWALRLRGDNVAAGAAFDSALVSLDSLIREQQGDWRVHAARGLALAGRGHRDEALREARWLEQSPVYRDDAYDGPVLAEDRALILAQAGDVGAALPEIERLLVEPSMLSVHVLRLDPRWDPIRDDPRFQALLRKHS